MLLLPLLAAAPRAGEPVFVRWNPPDGLCREEVFDATRIVERADVGRRIDRKATRVVVSYHTGPAGFVMAATTVSASATRDGQPREDRLQEFFHEVPLRYQMDLVGRLVGIDGLARVVERVRAQPAADEGLKAIVREESYIGPLREDWEIRYGQLLGRRLAPGDSWRKPDEYLLPAGNTLVFYLSTRVAEKVRVEGRDCLRLEFFYHSAPEPATPDLSAPITRSEIFGGGERIVDPDTLLLYGEHWEFILRIAPGVLGPLPVSIHESEVCRFRALEP